jgi:FtsP/CotA-like multicopper oxidase with cupredoxin domain
MCLKQVVVDRHLSLGVRRFGLSIGPPLRTLVAVTATFSLASCGNASDVPAGAPDAKVVSVELRAAPFEHEFSPGKPSRVAAYSGSLPGPVIRARRGDRLRVTLENALAVPTTLHFHGIRLPNAMDGVPDMTQPPVQPGGRFEYEFELPDAGLYWYHPHYDSLAALGSGLYGAIVVDDPDEQPDLGDETVLVLSDVSLDANGTLVAPARDPDSLFAGSDGNVVLVNGAVQPRLEVPAGRRQRWRILNAARARYFKLGLPGITFLQIGADGGALERPVPVSEPVITPGERLDVLVEFGEAVGTSLELSALPIARGIALPESAALPLMTVVVVPPLSTSSPPLRDLTRHVSPIDLVGAAEVPIDLTLNDHDGGPAMGINGVSGSMSGAVHALVGTSQILNVRNFTPYSHPFHLHGFFFQPLDGNGTPLAPLSAKDTIDVPPLSAVKLGVHYDDRPGMWMFHCHILDHSEAGMMGMLHVTR